MTRGLLGLALIAHGLGHTHAGMLAADRGRLIPAALWLVASCGFTAAGAGLLGVRHLATLWRSLTFAAGAGSIALLLFFRPPMSMPGLLIDLAFVVVAYRMSLEVRPAVVAGVENARPWHRRVGRVGRAIGVIFVAYLAAVLLTRPYYMRWGTTVEELVARLPGDDLVPNSHYTIQHAVTIRAAPERIWPWLMQLGQDRGGFYSYDWLERAFRADVHNADRVHPEWQTLREGDLVRAVQPDYLGSIFGSDLGWRVTRLEPNRVLVLENWGAFVLEPDGSGATRLIVRTRGAGEPGLASIALSPFGLLVFEPAHFVMQRRMLLGIKERVERS